MDGIFLDPVIVKMVKLIENIRLRMWNLLNRNGDVVLFIKRDEWRNVEVA